MVIIGGLEKVSLIDYPGKVAAIVFTYGCNLRCPYCHNPELVIEKLPSERKFSEKYVLDFLKERKGKLDGVVITGGEPLIHMDIESFISKIKKLGFLVKLDTNGFYPERLQTLIDKKMTDYIAMDVKYPKSKYLSITNINNSKDKITQSIKIIMNSGLDYEFRTTYVKHIHTIDSAKEIGKMIRGAKNYYIQNFRPGKTIDPTLTSKDSFTQKELEQISDEIKKYVKNVYIR